jgi:hypothetical protein
MQVTKGSKVVSIGQKSKAKRTLAPEFKSFRERLNTAFDAYASVHFPESPHGAMTAIAEKAGISVSTLSKALNEPGRELSYNVVLLIADALRHTVNPYWLLLGQGPSGLKN